MNSEQESTKRRTGILEKIVLVGGALAFIFYDLLKNKNDNKDEMQVSDDADHRVQAIVSAAIARKYTKWSEGEIRAVIRDPKTVPELRQILDNELDEIVLIFKPSVDESRVELVAEIQWNDGKKIYASEKWTWNQVPQDIRATLKLKQEPMYVIWQLPG